MMTAAPILDPVRWVEAFASIPVAYKSVSLGLLALWIAFRYWPWRKRNGK